MWPDFLVPIFWTTWHPLSWHPGIWLITILDQSQAKNTELIILKTVLFTLRTFNFSLFFGTLLGFCLAVFSFCKLWDSWINLFHLFLAKVSKLFFNSFIEAWLLCLRLSITWIIELFYSALNFIWCITRKIYIYKTC